MRVLLKSLESIVQTEDMIMKIIINIAKGWRI